MAAAPLDDQLIDRHALGFALDIATYWLSHRPGGAVSATSDGTGERKGADGREGDNLCVKAT